MCLMTPACIKEPSLPIPGSNTANSNQGCSCWPHIERMRDLHRRIQLLPTVAFRNSTDLSSSSQFYKLAVQLHICTACFGFPQNWNLPTLLCTLCMEAASPYRPDANFSGKRKKRHANILTCTAEVCTYVQSKHKGSADYFLA